MNAPKLSACIICKNEAANLERCLRSLSFVDEIVIVDSGSTDETLDIARRYTDRVFVRDDWAGFGLQRRRAEELATHDWILAIDADEEISPELAQAIRSALASIDSDQVIELNRLTRFMGRWIRHSGWHPDPIVRIYNRTRYRYNKNLVHESVDCGKAARIRLQPPLFHYQDDALADYVAKRNRYALAGAEARFRRDKKGSLARALLSALAGFTRHYLFRLGFLDGRAGLIIAVIQAQYGFNKYAFLADLQRQAEQEP